MFLAPHCSDTQKSLGNGQWKCNITHSNATTESRCGAVSHSSGGRPLVVVSRFVFISPPAAHSSEKRNNTVRRNRFLLYLAVNTLLLQTLLGRSMRDVSETSRVSSGRRSPQWLNGKMMAQIRRRHPEIKPADGVINSTRRRLKTSSIERCQDCSVQRIFCFLV